VARKTVPTFKSLSINARVQPITPILIIGQVLRDVMFLHLLLFITFDEKTLQNNNQSSTFNGSDCVHKSMLRKALFKVPKEGERVKWGHGSTSGLSMEGVDNNCANFQKFINQSKGGANNPRN
jgi:hypothetical protein